MTKTIAIVGAGFAGLSSAKILKAFGHSVTVFEKEADVGGVWSAARRYPGLTTQNVRSTYALSDFPYPADYPEWPSGEQVQRYLESYVRHFGLAPLLRLNTEVVSADLDEAAGTWTIETRGRGGASETHNFDYLLVCNGIFSAPLIPDYPGADAFRACGGRLLHTSEFKTIDEARDRNVVVVGYGKSSCDVAQAIAPVSRTTTVVARNLIWKVPKKLMNVLNYKYLLLTRMGEGLFRYIHLSGFEKFLHGPGKPIRRSMLGQVEWVITRQCKLKQLGLHPEKPFESIARSTVSLVSDGFYESVANGRIRVEKNAAIQSLGTQGGKPTATLGSGSTLAADVVICGTGWHQRVPFLSPDLQGRITDGRGNFKLYRSMVPVGVPCLAFNGYNSSFFSQSNCEIGALWIADLIGGTLKLPGNDAQERIIAERLDWMEERTDGKHAKGTNIIPFSVHHIDELLADMDLSLGPLTRLKQWLMPINPADFASATTRALRRHGMVA